jgi:glucan biosynthesis protein C
MDVMTRTVGFRLSTFHFWFIYFLFLYCLGYYLLWKSGWKALRWLESTLSDLFRRSSGTPSLIILAGTLCSTLFILRGHRATIDYSPGIVPSIPVLGAYAIYFFTGIILFQTREEMQDLFSNWRLYLFLALLVGAGYLYAMKMLELPPDRTSVWLSASLLDSLLAWLMLFGCMGFFNHHFSRRNGTVTYLSDAAYWVYIIHHPVILILAGWMQPFWMPLPLKYSFIVALTFAIGLLSYQYLVRGRAIGHLLNGRKNFVEKQNLAVGPQGLPG